MGRLGGKEMKALLAALDVLHSDIEPATLPARVLGALGTAVASEFVLLDSFGEANEMKPLGQHPADAMSAVDYELTAHYVHEHPLFPRIILGRQTTPLRMSDFASAAGFHRTAFYNEVYKRMSITDQIVVGLDVAADLFITCCFNRVRKEFSEGERRTVELIKSHLVTAARSARTLERLQSVERFVGRAFETTSLGIVALDADGSIKYMTDSAAALLHKYFGPRSLGHKQLSGEVDVWLRRRGGPPRRKEFYGPARSLKVKSADAELRINLSIDGRTAERVLLIEEKSYLSPEELRALGLTRRESEVLFWVARGKTDAEIGRLCNISPRTAQIHLGHIYTKLGVENRTAATLMAMELLT